jgi:hypothetical protein
VNVALRFRERYFAEEICMPVEAELLTEAERVAGVIEDGGAEIPEGACIATDLLREAREASTGKPRGPVAMRIAPQRRTATFERRSGTADMDARAPTSATASAIW